ncbi:MAG: hypothetical protein ACREQR_13555 [Candidatus Binataceae bacterium]
MKLIIKEYLSSLRERDELDAILPDLLSQMGLNVYSRPRRGARQDGVDVGAVGSLNGGPERVYLLTIKSGDLTRAAWDTEVQSVRQSLNEIMDAYIPARLPNEHRGKEIAICICCGGDILEQVRPALEGFIHHYTKENIYFEEWNGDKLASLIQTTFLREDLLPTGARSHLRKSLAMLDEPETSYTHFAALIGSLSAAGAMSDTESVTAIRQMSICLWILFAWTREAGNMEAAYLCSELTLLHAWSIARLYIGQKNKVTQAIEAAFSSIFSAHQQIGTTFLTHNVWPHVNKLHALSTAVRSSCSLDVNLKLFDLLGRLALDGLWAYWLAQRCPPEETELKQSTLDAIPMYMSAIKDLISNNPVLLLPIKDSQSIDISIAVWLLAIDPNNQKDIRNWLSEILERARFSYTAHGQYPCTLNSYAELLTHPKRGDDEYRKNATSGSVLYPLIAIWAAILNDDVMYGKVAGLKSDHLQHCNFQLWYPDDSSEEHLYTSDGSHGAVLSHACVDRSKQDLLAQVFGECDRTPHYRELSAVKFGWWPLIVVACRHYRLPLPLHLLEEFKATTAQVRDSEERNSED